ncbi:MAG: RelA/SpoT domain-containing protein [Armatimonadota bacterium]
MAFSAVPSESRAKINRAGQILVAADSTPSDVDWARDLANRWRACHAYPINTFQATLRARLRGTAGAIVAQRLKRMPTIIDKLKRYPNMKLTTMQDIGGVRAVLDSVDAVRELAAGYKKSQFQHELVDERDYIANPRSEDGYRSLHLIYRYRNRRNPRYDGLRLELQIRTRLQHTWATAVETMGTFLGQALKSRQGDQAWLDFFAVTSSAFAYLEDTPPIPRYAGLSREGTALAVADAERRLGAVEMMTGISAAVKFLTETRRGWFYHLIVLDSLDHSVQVTGYDRDRFEQALADYSRLEREAAEGRRIEPVLVSAGPLDTLRRAYPNFFLDIGDFVARVTEVVNSAQS